LDASNVLNKDNFKNINSEEDSIEEEINQSFGNGFGKRKVNQDQESVELMKKMSSKPPLIPGNKSPFSSIAFQNDPHPLKVETMTGF